MIERLAAGAIIAVLVAGLGWRARALTRSGAAVAVAMGTLAVAAGWPLAILLILFFVASSALSRAGATRKASRLRGIVEKGGARDARQVLANGGIFALAAAVSLGGGEGWAIAAIGALAASTADTWGTEIGALARGAPRLVTTWRRVPAGTSGAVSGTGLAATVAGGAFIAVAAVSLGWPATDGAAVLAGGLAGAATDSLLGATVQERRRCASCGTDTEQRRHVCGAATRRIGGLAWLENDAVNLISSAVGAAVAASLST